MAAAVGGSEPRTTEMVAPLANIRRVCELGTTCSRLDGQCRLRLRRTRLDKLSMTAGNGGTVLPTTASGDARATATGERPALSLRV
jgi:hypothetical protein